MYGKLLKLTITTLLLVIFGYREISAVISPQVKTTKLLMVAKPKKVETPLEIANQITVRILTNPGGGSGVIVGHHRQIYTVLTNNHVAANSWRGKYSVLTVDGIYHVAKLVKFRQFNNLDLAIMQFTSSKRYRVAKIAQSHALVLGQPVYASGFPNWYWMNSNTPVSTLDWGLKSFKLTTGKVGMLLHNPLTLGYQLGYTNDVKDGMSGGSVIDKNGYLVGINGRIKYPFRGIDAYTFSDSSMPSQQQFSQMRTLSWAIPSTTFKQLLATHLSSLNYSQ